MTEKVIGLSDVTNNHRITLVKNVRSVMGIKPGDTIVFYQTDKGAIEIRKS